MLRMRLMNDSSDRRRGWLAISAKLFRATASLKLGVVLLLFALCFTVYMMIGALDVPSSSDLPPVSMKYHSALFSLHAGQEQHNAGAGGGRQTPMESAFANNSTRNNDVDLNQRLAALVMPTLSVEEVALDAARLTTNSTSNTTERQPKKMTYDRVGIAPVPCDSNNLEPSGLLDWEIPKYLPMYKNPCWREKIEEDSPEDMYKDNRFALYSISYRKSIIKLQSFWKKKDFSKPQYRLRCLPYFFLAGQPKCGSTDLYMKLISHPDIATMPTKEPHWWGKFRFGTIPFADYVDLFDYAALKIESVTEKRNKSTSYHPVITGDASVSTLWSNDGWWTHTENCGHMAPKFTNADYIRRLLPQAKILIILRNPTDRLYSDFLYFHESLKTQEAFHKGVKKSIIYFKKCVNEAGLRSCAYNYTVSSNARVRLRVGMYALYMDEWLALFPREQFLVLRLEDYADNPLAVLRQVHRFLDLRTLTPDENEELLEQPKANTRREKDRKLGRMLPKTRALLDKFYRPFNQKLAHILGDKRFLWDPT